MKNKIFYILIVYMIFPACQKDLLEKYPKTTLNAGIFWQDEKDLLSAVNGLYQELPGYNWIQHEYWTDLAMNSMPALNHKLEGTIQAIEMQAGGPGDVLELWEDCYRGVAATNYFLENTAEIQNMDENFLLRVEAEAKFIRAFIYMQLVMYFGDVPLITKTISQEEGFQLERNPANQIWDFIESELSNISENLPIQYSNSDKGRITAGAVYALKAKCMLYAERYNEAYDAAKQLINMNAYSLYPDYNNLFGYDAQNNPEVILDHPYLKDLLSTGFFYNYAPQEMSIGIARFSVTNDFVNAFQMKTTGLPIENPNSGYDPMDPYKDRDPRLASSIFIPYFSEDTEAFILWNTGKKLMPQPGSGTSDELGITDTRNKTGFFVRKYINKEDIGDPGNCGTNFIIIRYADVLLMASEALIELNMNLSEAKGYIDQIRARAGMPLLSENILNQNDLRQALRHERLVELGLEGWRFFDINRWRIAEDVIEGIAYGMSWLDENGNIQTYNTGVDRNFIQEKDYLLPIPLSEIKMNPNLTQNPGY